MLVLFPLRAEFAFDASSSRWALDNGSARAVFQLTPDGKFGIQSFANLATGESWDAPAGALVSPVQLQVDNTVWDARTSFRLVSQTASSAQTAMRQTIVLEDTGGTGRLQVDFEMVPGYPALQYQVRFRNLRSSAVTVKAADMLPWNFDTGGHTFQAFRVNQWVSGGTAGNFEPVAAPLTAGGDPFAVYSGSYGQQCAWLAVRDEADRGLFAGWAFDGRAIASVQYNGGALQFSAQVLDLNRPLAANQEFVIPAAFIGSFHGDWDEAGYRTQRFAEASFARALPDDRFPYVIWDSWSYQTNLTEDELRQNAARAASIGIEVFVVDLGWAKAIGNWYEDPAKFPHGLRSLSDYVHSLGMKFGLHFPFAEAAPGAPVLQQNPDWTSSADYGYFGAQSLCLAHQPVRDWVVSEAVRMIDAYNVDWVLQDGENMVKQCTKTTHTHDPEDSNYSNAVDGLDYVVRSVQKQKPKTLWENCEDGGNMMTYDMVRRYVTSIAADNSDILTTRQSIYGVTFPFSPRYADRYMTDQNLSTYALRSYMFGGPWIFMNRLPQLKSADLTLAAREVATYKSLRSRIRDGKVFHLTARPGVTPVDALESFDPVSGSAVAFVYVTSAAGTRPTIALKGLDPDLSYLVHYQDSTQVQTLSGAQLLAGVTVPLTTAPGAEIMYVDPVVGNQFGGGPGEDPGSAPPAGVANLNSPN